MELEVTVQVDGSDVRAGTLYAHARRGAESASIRYDGGYLADPRSFPLAPDMPLSDGSLHTQGEPMFRVFEDCMPDRWGRNLVLRAERRAACEWYRLDRSQAVAEARKMARVLKGWRKAATLNIGSFSIIASGFVMSPVAAALPDSRFAACNCPTDELKQGLADGRFDVLLATDAARDKPFKWLKAIYEMCL